MSSDVTASNDQIDVDDVCFMARALAQTHPLTPAALRYKQSCFEHEREHQPVDEVADWATTALLVGYCLRRAEEKTSGHTRELLSFEAGDFAQGANELAAQLSEGDASSITLLPPASTIAALDRIIGTEVHKRNEHLREQLDDGAWSELEQYIAWWVVHGYCVRALEAPKA